jgi:hypothetical protein
LEETEWYYRNHINPDNQRILDHKETIVNFVNSLVEPYKKINFDFKIEVVKVQASTIQSANYLLKTNMFLKDNPNHTFTLFTIRCSEFNDFPVSLDVNYCDTESFEFLFSETKEDLLFLLNKYARKGFRNMSNSILEYTSYVEGEPKNPDRHTTLTINNDKNNQWTNMQDETFKKIINDYRENIKNKTNKEVRTLTRDYAFLLKKENGKILYNRTEESIAWRLAYLDELFAGLGELDDYQIKDQHYFGTIPRPSESTDINPARTRRKKKKQ